MAKELIVDGVVYVPKQDLASKDGLKFCVIRCDRSGVFFGYLKKLEGTIATVLDARQCWSWKGANNCIDLAVQGVKDPVNCRFTQNVAEIMLLDVIEVIQCTEEAKNSLEGVKVWKA